MKSDLKLIECLAHGVVPICSPVVYAERSEHMDIAYFAESPQEWVERLCEAAADLSNLEVRRAAGRAYVARERMHWQMAPSRDAWYRRISTARVTLEALRQARLQRFPLSI
jgi:chemotaxis response regulator CheB